ncbi:MAG: TraV family lipoprotein [Methylococcaceae bacterium]
MSSRTLNRIVVILLTALLSGCATQYGCKGMPDDPKCLSATEAYQVTDKALYEPPKVDAAVHPTVSVSMPNYKLQPVPKIDDPTPIRIPAQVMRIWIAPWEDSEGDLMVSNYVYTELEPRRWMIGKSAPTISPSLIPLQIEQRPPEKPLEREPAGPELQSLPKGSL